MKPFFKKLIIGVLTLAVGITQAQEVTKTYTGIKKINLTTSSGDVELVKSGSAEVKVKVTFTYSRDEYQPMFEQNGSTLVLKEDFNKRSVSGQAKWLLTVPDGLDIKLTSGSGDFEANDLKVNISAHTGSGDYSWTNVSGESKINTGSGDIKVDTYQGNIDVNTGSGNIDLAKTTGDAHLNAGSGDVSIVSIKGGVSANTGSGNIKAQEVTLTSKGSFNSGSGNVLIVLSSPLAYNLSVNSGSGDAVVDLKGSKLEGKLVMTANKRNGEIKAPFTFDKTETIEEGNNEKIRKTVQLGASTVEIKIGTGSGTAEVKK